MVTFFKMKEGKVYEAHKDGVATGRKVRHLEQKYENYYGTPPSNNVKRTIFTQWLRAKLDLPPLPGFSAGKRNNLARDTSRAGRGEGWPR